MKLTLSILIISLIGKSLAQGGVPIYPVQVGNAPSCILGRDPVCSTDKVTFPNICVLLLTGRKKASNGWCAQETIIKVNTVSYKTPNNGYLTANQNSDPNSPCACNSAYNPTCGNNGVTYASRCRMECANVALSHNGPCNYFNWLESPHFNCPCDYQFAPVCGQDGSTYENTCAIKCGHQAIKHEGACLNPCNCTNTYKPLCSKKGKTFQNRCMMKCEEHVFYKKGKCPDKKPAHCSHCEGLKSPACGTNGITYDNDCYLRCAGVEKYQAGVCPGDDSYQGSVGAIPSCNTCKNVNLPVCGNDGVSYQNACKARCKGMSIEYKGKCLSNNDTKLNQCGCPAAVSPVCGRDGRTYTNSCEAQCKNIGILYNNACAPVNPNYCSHLCGNSPGAPVCGKDFKTYLNECVASRCMRVPIREFKTCEPLNSANYPHSFAYNQSPAQQAPPPRMPAPVPQQAPIQNNQMFSSQAPVQTQVHVQAQASPNISQLDLTDVNQVKNIYRKLFPNGQAINAQVINYKPVLEQLLSKWNVDPRSLH